LSATIFQLRHGRRLIKVVGFRCGITEQVLDAIAGHAPVSTARLTLADKTP
jgi:hypothetical protein